jgi:hypothetical protein
MFTKLSLVNREHLSKRSRDGRKSVAKYTCSVGAGFKLTQYRLKWHWVNSALISQEVQDLATQKGVQLPSEVSDEHKQKLKELSSRSGHAFDRGITRMKGTA